MLRWLIRLDPVSLILVSSTSDSIFLLGGVVNVILFCTIRRVIPIKEVATGLLNGKIFQPQEPSSTDSTWCIGSMESGEKHISAALSLPADNDYFALRQPKFEIVSPPPAAHSPDRAVTETPAQTSETAPTHKTGLVVHVDPPKPTVPKTRLIPRKPLPAEPSIHSEDGDGSDRFTSFSRQSSFRRLPPIPQGPQPVALPPFVEKRGTPPPPYRPGSSHDRQSSVSGPVRSHSHSRSYDSVVSDASSMSGSTLFGSSDDGLKNEGLPGEG